MLGITCRPHDENTADDLGLVHAPPPVEPDDLIATADEIFRVVSVITNAPGSTIGALVKVRPARLVVASR
jgi:hypothetical protein